MTDQEKKLYELAIKEGDRRFGSPCSHTRIINGVCANCCRKIWQK